VNAIPVWLRNGRLIVAVSVVIVCTGLAVGLFLASYASLIRSSFHERTVTYAQAFAATAGSWLARGDVDVVETLAQFLVAGSVVSVDVVDPSGVAIHWGSAMDDAPAGGLDSVAVVRRGPSHERYLDITTPIASSGGHVRMVVDTASSEAAIRLAATFGAVGAVVFDAGIIGLLAWALRGRRRGDHIDEVASPAEASAEQIAVGDLVIVPTRCAASFAGRPLRLTPKQYALLTVLASEPGRVFSEAEILSAAWPDSPYADARDIKQYVYLLRRRLSEIRPDGREVIVTVPGFGYRLEDGR
jgi:DNA-binding winged helix-turn-helix (wHTH) protein